MINEILDFYQGNKEACQYLFLGIPGVFTASYFLRDLFQAGRINNNTRYLQGHFPQIAGQLRNGERNSVLEAALDLKGTGITSRFFKKINQETIDHLTEFSKKE